MRRAGMMLLGLAIFGTGKAAAQERVLRAFAAVAPPEGLDEEHERLLEAATRWARGDRWYWKQASARERASPPGGCTTTAVTYGDYEADGSRNRVTQTTCSRDVSIRTNPEPKLHNARTEALAEYRDARDAVADRLERAGAALPEAPSAYPVRRAGSVFTSLPRHRF